MLALLDKLKADTGITLLWADHFIPELLQVVQKVLEIDNRAVEGRSVDDYIQQGMVRKVQGET